MYVIKQPTVEIVAKAASFAELAHHGQMRKFGTNQPYFKHVERVANTLVNQGHGNDYNLIAAAYLHDVVEDCNVTFEQLIKTFNPQIAELVWWVSSLAHNNSGNRETRCMVNEWRLARAPDGAKLIKLADILDNCSDLKQYASLDYWFDYTHEKRDLCRAMFENVPGWELNLLKQDVELLLNQAHEEYIIDKNRP